jgi:hypothetical protein
MALIQGTKGLCPCSVCLVPQKQLHAFDKEYPLWTTKDSHNTFKLSKAAMSAKDGDKMLKEKGLWDVEVFSCLCHSLFG